MYHKYCFKCAECTKRLDSNFVEHDEEPFCRPCHRNKFGTQDLRSANLSPNRTRSVNLPQVDNASPSVSTSPQISPPLAMSEETDFSPRHPGGRSMATSWSSRNSTLPHQQTTGSPHSPRRELAPSYTGGMFSRSNAASRVPTMFGSSPSCPRCNKAVYFAEQVNAIGKKWHKACLTCSACNKRLDSYSLQEHDEEPYCRACYRKQFSVQDLRSANLSPTAST